MLYVNSLRNRKEHKDRDEYPYNIPSIQYFDQLDFHTPVTFLIGENGMGKSTLVEAIAIKSGFNPEGGGRNFNFSTLNTHSELYQDLVLVRGPYRNKDGYFLRAESFYNVSSEIERIDKESNSHYLRNIYNGLPHEKSHGESFMALIESRFFGNGLYILDEPEAALSVSSQLKLLVLINQLTKKNSQFIIATHSPILMAYPEAEIYAITPQGPVSTNYFDTEQYKIAKYFLNNPSSILKELGFDVPNSK